jgi:hypothetical protein
MRGPGSAETVVGPEGTFCLHADDPPATLAGARSAMAGTAKPTPGEM